MSVSAQGRQSRREDDARLFIAKLFVFRADERDRNLSHALVLLWEFDILHFALMQDHWDGTGRLNEGSLPPFRTRSIRLLVRCDCWFHVGLHSVEKSLCGKLPSYNKSEVVWDVV